VTLPLNEPVLVPSPICRDAPELMTVPPPQLLPEPVRVTALASTLTTPLASVSTMAPPKAKGLVRLNARAPPPLNVTLAPEEATGNEPAPGVAVEVPPICTVPPWTTVPPV